MCAGGCWDRLAKELTEVTIEWIGKARLYIQGQGCHGL